MIECNFDLIVQIFTLDKSLHTAAQHTILVKLSYET